MVGAELPTNSDLIKWAEQGRLHTKYTGLTYGALGTPAAGQQVFTLPSGSCVFRVGQTVFLSSQSISSESAKGIIVAVTTTTFTVAYYTAFGSTPFTSGVVTAFVYGSEFRKGTNGMVDSLEAQDLFFDNKPIIIKDKYTVSGFLRIILKWQWLKVFLLLLDQVLLLLVYLVLVVLLRLILLDLHLLLLLVLKVCLLLLNLVVTFGQVVIHLL